VAFPATTEKIGKFISGLLGQPQTISREVSGIFDINLNWLNHVNSLIEQRIKQQNDAALTSFSAKIFYDGDLIRTLQSVEALKHFSETKMVRSVGVELHWNYIIKFPGKEIPEKQEITLGVFAKGSKYVTVGLQPIKLREAINLGRITYSIAHTERTWGDDIESILRQEIDVVTKKTRWYESYYENSLMVLGLICLMAGFLFPDYMNDRLEKEALSKIQPAIAQIADPNAFALLEVPKKLDLIAQFVNPANTVTRVGIKYRVVSALVGLGLMIMCAIWSDIRRASFVVLTKEAEIHRSDTLKKEQRKLLVFFLSFAASVAASVVASYAYLYLST